jgi:hypothetical protein
MRSLPVIKLTPAKNIPEFKDFLEGKKDFRDTDGILK